MKGRLLSLCLLVASTPVCFGAPAEKTAVSAPNAELSAAVVQVDDPVSDVKVKINAYAVNANFQLKQYLGLNLYYMRGNGEVTSTLLDYNYDYSVYAISPFIRDPDTGLIGVSVGRTTLDLGSAFPISKLKQKDLELLVAGYFGPVTLSVNHIHSEDVDGINPDQNYGWVNAVWYGTPDFLIEASAGYKEARHGYAIGLEHQPFGSLPQLSYGLGYSWNSDTEEKTVALTLSYRFAARKTLMKRYREDLFGYR